MYLKKNKSKSMRVFNVVGYSSSGKTTLVESIVSELKSRDYSVGTVKSISCGSKGCAHRNVPCSHGEENNHRFSIDTKGSDTNRHKVAGADQIASWAVGETAIIRDRKLKLYELIENFDLDFLIIEGGKNLSLPRVITGIEKKDLDAVWSNQIVGISGKIADSITEYKDVKTYKTYEEINKLVDRIEELVYPTIGHKDCLGCSMCNMTCKELGELIFQGERSSNDCKRRYPDIEIDKPEFKEEVQKLLYKLDSGNLPKLNIEIK